MSSKLQVINSLMSYKSILQDATTATSYIIDNFGMRDLFGRDNYEYYARLTGRILKVTPNVYKKGEVLILCLQVEDEWIFFTYPLDCLGIRSDLDLDLRNRRSANPCFFCKFKANELISAITSMIQPEAWK